MHNIYLNRAFFCAIHCIGKHALGLRMIHRLNGFSNYRDGERRNSGFTMNAHIDKDRNRALAFQSNCWTTGTRTIIPSVFRGEGFPFTSARNHSSKTRNSRAAEWTYKTEFKGTITTLHLDLCYLCRYCIYIYIYALNEEAPDRRTF